MGLLDYIQEKGKGILAGGAKPRAIVSGLLGGDTSALQGAWNELKQLGDPNYMRKVKGINNDEAMNIALDANPVFALSTGGKLADALARPKTQYEIAHEIAQKNAVEMLGLPPNNTAMDRARAMGYETAPSKELYHSARKGWESSVVDPSKSDLGFHVGNLDQANYRSKVFSPYEEGGNIMPLMKNKYANMLTLKDEGSFHADSIAPQLEKKKILPKGYTKEILNDPIGDKSAKMWDEIYDAKMREAITKEGYDGVKYSNIHEGNGISYAFTNPSKIRSRFAAFDPARAHEADLLGNASPELLAYLSGAGLLGAGAYKYSQGDK